VSVPTIAPFKLNHTCDPETFHIYYNTGILGKYIFTFATKLMEIGRVLLCYQHTKPEFELSSFRVRLCMGGQSKTTEHFVSVLSFPRLHNLHIYPIPRRWGSSVSTMSNCRFDDRGSIPDRGKEFSLQPLCADQLCGPPRFLSNG
jgi:hypothetical protein